jgi:hypothetical protein
MPPHGAILWQALWQDMRNVSDACVLYYFQQFTVLKINECYTQNDELKACDTTLKFNPRNWLETSSHGGDDSL